MDKPKLSDFSYDKYSQFGEDGIIEKIFEAVKEIFTDSKAFHSELGKVMIIAIQRMAEREQKFKGRDS